MAGCVISCGLFCIDCSQTKRKSVSQVPEDDKAHTEDVEKDKGHEDKRGRMEQTTRSTNADSKPIVTVSCEKALPPVRCSQCRQLLDDPDLRLFPGDPCEAVYSFFVVLGGIVYLVHYRRLAAKPVLDAPSVHG